MKISFLLMSICISLVITKQDTHAALSIDCSNSGALMSTKNPYENIYHSGVTNKITQTLLGGCYQQYLYSKAIRGGSGSGISLSLLQIFPIYHPKQETPRLLQVVNGGVNGGYTSMLSIPTNVFDGSYDTCKGVRFPDNWLNLSCGGQYTKNERKSLYLLSQSESYKTSPQIQFYVYKLGMLLVARDSSGEVIRWDYERKDVTVTERQLRGFLGDKWYHP